MRDIIGRTGFASIALAAWLATGCTSTGSSDEARRVADASAEKARKAEMETRESAKRALEARIVELENRIAVLKHDAKPASRKAGAKMDIQFDALESRLKVLRTRLSEAGREGWAQTKDTTLTALEKAEQKLDELRNEMQKK